MSTTATPEPESTPAPATAEVTTSPLTNVVTEHATVTTGIADGTRVVAVTPDSVTGATAPSVPVPEPVANPVPMVRVPYVHPHLRALSAAQRTALASLAAALATLVLRLLYNFVQGGNYTAAAVQSLVMAVIMGSITVLVSYLQKYAEASGDDALKLATNPTGKGTSLPPA
ncbi:MAG TPA: hypothetical protein VIG47_14490 [Gemmatimonadaceae bacterium]